MSSRPAQPQPTTQEHEPPRKAQTARGRPILLAAFPRQLAVPLPAPGAAAGRDWLASVGHADPEVSGSHFRLTQAAGRLQIEDAGSRNGTWINGYRLAPGERAPLEDGDILRLGSTLFVYRESFEGPLEPRPPRGRMIGPWGLAAVHGRLDALAARPDLTVLIEGETGTGKELLAEEVARALRREHRFGRFNVAGIAASVFEGQLFGWERGAFSGSTEANPGLLRRHHGGAVFLDEIGELPLDLQAKLLRVLEERKVLPVGASQSTSVDVAILAATNRRLEEHVERGAFRRDLLARFITRLSLPPLRDRAEDLYAITQVLWQARHGPLDPARAHVEAVELMMLHDWPENVRGLTRLVAGQDPEVGLDLAQVEQALGERAAAAAAPPPTREVIERTIAACGGNKSKAAELLGISRGKLQRTLGGPRRG